MDQSQQWDLEHGAEPKKKTKGSPRYTSQETHHSDGSLVSVLTLRETQEESLSRLANPIGIVSSILAGALLALFLNPPQTVYDGFDSADWIGCCKNMPSGTCYRFAVALVAFLFIACCCSIASLVFIVAASLKATAAARRSDRLEGSTAAIANFIASKWMLYACVYQAYIVLLLYAPIAYPLSILILAAAVLGTGSLLTVALFWGQFWDNVGEDLAMLRYFFSKKVKRIRTKQPTQRDDLHIAEHSCAPMCRPRQPADANQPRKQGIV